MRMDQRQEITAAKLLATYSESQTARLFEQYGEVTMPPATLAPVPIVQQRNITPLQIGGSLQQALHPVVKGNLVLSLAQVSQALQNRSE